jgi:hypothetical protein
VDDVANSSGRTADEVAKMSGALANEVGRLDQAVSTFLHLAREIANGQKAKAAA